MTKSRNCFKKIFVIISVIGLLCILGISTFAATSDSAYYMSFIPADKDLFGEKYAPAQKLNSGEIQLATGEVSISETDVSLPGKNGLDLNIQRIYNSQEPQHEMEHATLTSKYSIHNEKAYYYTVMDGSGRRILVSFESEAEMLDSFYSTETKLEKTLKEDEYGTIYQTYSVLKASDGTILLERDKNEYMEDIYTARTRVVLRDVKREGNIYLTNNKDWEIAMPYIYHIGSYMINSREMHYYRFGNEKGEVYTLKFSVVTDDDYDEPLGTVYSERIYSTDYSISVLLNEAEMTHTLSLTNREGKIYEFDLGDVISSPHRKITDARIIDRYGNSITYSNNEITDSYGRKLRVSSSGIEIFNGTEYKPLVKYEFEEIYDPERDPQGLLDIFTKTYFTVSRSSSLIDDEENVFDDTIYVMQLKETDSPVDWCENSYVSVLNEVIYSDGQKYVYTYEAENTKSKDPANYYNANYTYTVPRVVSFSEQIKTGTAYTERINRSFKYSESSVSYTYQTAANVTEKVKLNGTEYKTISYVFDFTDRLLEKTEKKDTDKTVTRYLHRMPQGEYKISNIERDDYIAFRQMPVGGIVVSENNVVVNMTYFEYTRDGKPKLIQRGLHKETYVYDETYGFMLEYSTTTDKGKKLHTVNTKTADGKSIAQTRLFEVIDGEEILQCTTDYTYNTDGTLASQTTTAGGTTNYTYDYSLFSDSTNGKHTVTASIVTEDAMGVSRTETSSIEYDLMGNEKKITDGRGNTTVYTYDLMGRIVEEEYADGTRRSIVYDIANRIVTVTEPNGRKVAKEYNHNGNLLKTYLPDESNQILSSNTYDSLERKTKSTVYTDAYNTVSEEYEYDFFDRVVKKTDYQNNTIIETTNYITENNAEKVAFKSTYCGTICTLNGEYAYALVLTNSNTTYNVSHTPYLITKADGVELGRHNTYLDDVFFSVYDLSGVNEVTFDIRMGGNNYVILVKNEDVGIGSGVGAQTVTSTFTGDSSFVRPKEVTKYDHSGATIYTELRDNITDEVLSRDEYEYDFSGKVTEYRDSKVTLDNAGEYTSRVEYNYLGQPTKEINALGDCKTYTYDALGRLLTATDETGVTVTYTYDVLGREIVAETNTSETEKARTEKYYDPSGNIVKERIGNNPLNSADTFREVSYEYDNMNRLITVTHDTGIYSGTGAVQNGIINYTQYKYDTMGNLAKTVTGQTEKLDLSQTVSFPHTVTSISYEYDRFGNVTKQTNMAGLSETASYNLIGLPTSTTDRKGVTTTYTYNAYGSPLTVSTTGMDTITYTYNVNNVLLKAEQGDDVIIYEYDNLGRVTKETENGIVKTYQTDRVGNITYAEIAGEGTTYTYDNLNRITGASFNGGSASYTYDDAGRLTGEAKGGITTVYTYNPAGWLSSKTNSDGAETDTYILTYYSDGNLYTKTENGIATTYVYDGRGQLIRENNTVYAYDTKGNRVMKADSEDSVTYGYSSDNQLMFEESSSVIKDLSYDANGNLVKKDIYNKIYDEYGVWNIEFADSEVIAYDPLNRMTSYSSSDVNATYTYGIDNMRRSKTVNNVTTNYIWDGGNIVAEADGSNAVTNRYFRGIGLIASKTGNNISYYQTNSHGDVSKWGAVDYSYDAFGNETTASNGNNPFRYNGEYYDAESGLIYLRNRYYDPSMGRFINEDPIKDGANWYAYCANNPVMFVDPWGLQTLLDVLRYTNDNPDTVQRLYKEKGALGSWQAILELSAPTTPVNIIEKENAIIVYSYVNLLGNAKDNTIANTNIKYGEAALFGIEEVWSGEYNGKEVASWVIESTVEPSVNIEINKGLGITRVKDWESFENPGTVVLYTANHKNKSWYNHGEFYKNAGHEFGHVFGIGDMYSDKGFADYKTMSIMNNQIIAKKAQQIDYAMLFKAQREHEFQLWSNNIDFLFK